MDNKKPITDRIKTFKDACVVLKISYTETMRLVKKRNNKILITEKRKIDDDCFYSPLDEGFCEKETKASIALLKLRIICKALNEGWVPDFNNESEYKYYPYFNAKSGFGFSCAYYAYTNADSTVGFCLCFKTRELAEYAGRQFESIYKDYLA